MNISVNLLVLRCRNIEVSRKFYEKLGIKFNKEKHGSGPEHFAAEVGNLIFELYPLNENEKPDNNRVGFSTPLLADVSGNLIHDKDIQVVEQIHERNGHLVLVVKDPDGRKVEVTQKLHEARP